MADRSRLLTDVLRRGWPTMSHLNEGRVVRPLIADEIHRRLEQYRICMVTGPPKSGKSTLACRIGWEILVGKRGSPFQRVRYLDLTDIENPDDVRDTMHMGKNWVLILDNWHAGSHCHIELLDRIKTDWRDVGCLLLDTQFPGAAETLELPSPLIALGQGEENAPIDTEVSAHEVARGMIELHVQTYLGTEPTCKGLDLIARAKSKNAHFDLEDYQQALVAPGEHKKVRGNLRFLSWRLRVWNLAERHLRDVPLGKVIEAVEQAIVVPYRARVGTLEKVAALAQWNLPYLRIAGQNPPEGIAELERKNVVVPMKRGAGWRMDSTDAYLVMLTTSGQHWVIRTLGLLREYLNLNPERTSHVVRNILKQAAPDISTILVLGLLGSRPLQEAEKKYLTQLAASNRLSFGWLNSLANCLLRDLPNDPEEANRRFDVASALFSKEMGNPFGNSARTAGLQTIMWFLKHLRKGEARFSEFVTSFLEGYGKDTLITSFCTAPWTVRQGLLRLLRYFDPSLYGRLRAVYPSTSVSREEIPFTALLYQLMRGCIEAGSVRHRKIEMLASIDEDYLLRELQGNPRAVGRLQFLLQSALWLSKGQAWRLASLVPRIWPELNLFAGSATAVIAQDEAGKLGFLVTNCLFANRSAAEDLVDLFLKVPLHTLVQMDKASGIGRILSAVERVQPGALKGWCSTEIDYLSRLFPLLETNALDETLIALATFAPDLLVSTIEECSEEITRGLFVNCPCLSAWIRRAALDLCKENLKSLPVADLPSAEEIATCEPAQSILALYGLQLFLGVEGVHSLLASLVNSPKTSPWIPLLWARNLMPWESNQVGNMLRTILRAGFDPKASALQNVVVVGMTLRAIEWARGHKFDAYHDGHRALQTAIHEKILQLELCGETQVVRAAINDQHHLVHSTRNTFDEIVKPLRGSHVSLTEWDTALHEAGIADDLGYYRSKLIKSGLVAWSINAQADQPQPQFSISAEPNEELLYRLIDLPSSISPAGKPAAKSTPIRDSNQYDFTNLIRRVRDLEVTNQFVSLKRLRREFASEQGMQDCLDIAIERRMLSTYYVRNRKNPRFPTLACKLDREHALVKELLQSIARVEPSRALDEDERC